jgi:hypothetical protein
VFVFEAPNEIAANQLVDQVKYQQVVQWLGENPYSYREAVAEFTQTTLDVLVSVVKASGLVLLGSLLVGGFFGALLFTRRRAQQQLNTYSDAGGMLRLNLDEISAETDPARLIGPGNEANLSLARGLAAVHCGKARPFRRLPIKKFFLRLSLTAVCGGKPQAPIEPLSPCLLLIELIPEL